MGVPRRRGRRTTRRERHTSLSLGVALDWLS
jgi:hypothetical protein